MKKLILFLAAFCMATGPAFAMGSSGLIPHSNQPVAAADLAAFKGDFTAFTKCITDQHKNDAFAADPRYRYMFRDYTDAVKAANNDNAPKFLQFRSDYNAKAAPMAADFGCVLQVTPLSTERA